MSKEALEKAQSELKKLRMMSPMSADATVVRNYIEWLVQVPWKKRSRVLKDLGKAEQILEDDHYGLIKVKERILEYLAVQQRIKKVKGPILCLASMAWIYFGSGRAVWRYGSTFLSKWMVKSRCGRGTISPIWSRTGSFTQICESSMLSYT